MALVRNRYRLVHQLAQTPYGGVFLCNDEFQRPRRVVLKCVSLRQAISALDRSKARLQAPDDPRQEKAFSHLQRTEAAPHPHIVQYLDDFIEGHTLYFVLEYCVGGDLYAAVNRTPSRRLPGAEALRVTKQLATAVADLHRRGIVHRDLSLENVLLSRGVCKIADFGLSARAEEPCGQRVGKAYYMAPEVVARGVVYDPKAADVWSLGIILFILVTGSPLVPLATEQDAAFRVFRTVGVREVLQAWGMAESTGEAVLQLLEGMLQCDPGQRLTAEQVLNHAAFARRAAAA
ncbi:hypothetical protein PHYPSEUDO_012891 [Phytophthora pseudosyringae]|uniref:Protein kinase domain-containing protein n=1 Tax=Phytophthora pseudosyringae TaxID=221518 RepID=A0A8T1W7V5_9STRA|nr:hypothetical protein PHYPSEUDO_012891 [Phytophthora pseudosyringae]